MVDHLSCMSLIEKNEETHLIQDVFADDCILATTRVPWFVDFVNYSVGGVLPDDFDSNKKNFFYMIAGCICGTIHSFIKKG